MKLMVFMMSGVTGAILCQGGGSEDQAGAPITTSTLASSVMAALTALCITSPASASSSPGLAWCTRAELTLSLARPA